jgi:hypothetical protein
MSMRISPRQPINASEITAPARAEKKRADRVSGWLQRGFLSRQNGRQDDFYAVFIRCLASSTFEKV